MVANTVFSITTSSAPAARGASELPVTLLEIFQEAARRCQNAGIEISYQHFFSSGRRGVVIILEDVDLVEGKLTPAAGGGR